MKCKHNKEIIITVDTIHPEFFDDGVIISASGCSECKSIKVLGSFGDGIQVRRVPITE